MDGLQRCPQCFKVPEPKIDSDGKVTFECKRHGHMAIGETLDQAVKHWNKYIVYMVITYKSNPEPEGRIQ